MSILMKFGGTSVADAAAYENVAQIVAKQSNSAPVVVVSAMSRVTDALLASARITSEQRVNEAIRSLDETFERHRVAAKELLSSDAADLFLSYLHDAAEQVSVLLHQAATQPENRKATQDAIVSFGELLSSRLLAEVLKQHGITAQQVDPRDCIVTNDEYTCAAPLMTETFAKTRQSLLSLIEQRTVPVVGGFIGATTDGTTTTLGRGGSDTPPRSSVPHFIPTRFRSG